MTETDIRTFFANLRAENERYLKPCDEEYKLVEEYLSSNDLITIELLRDAYDLLVRAFDSKDGNLNEYLNMLKKARVRTICELVIARIIDLVTIPNLRITAADKEEIKNQLRDIHQKMTSTKVELDNPVNNDRLEGMINQWETEKNRIEMLCRKYDFGDIAALRNNAKHGK